VTGAVLAHELGAELNVVLSRKLRAPFQSEYALGAVSEDGSVFLNPFAPDPSELPEGYLEAERHHQLVEIGRRKHLVRGVRPAARIAGRSVIVTDDGIATGSTMTAALQTVRGKGPRELIVAVPVASQDRLAEVRRWCDDAVCLLAPADFWAVGQFYQDFSPVEDEGVLRILHESLTPGNTGGE
jgi:predicted phosphoribosyltransferase